MHLKDQTKRILGRVHNTESFLRGKY